MRSLLPSASLTEGDSGLSRDLVALPRRSTPCPPKIPEKVYFPARKSVQWDRILPPYYVPRVLRALALGVSPASGSGKRAPEELHSFSPNLQGCGRRSRQRGESGQPPRADPRRRGNRSPPVEAPALRSTGSRRRRPRGLPRPPQTYLSSRGNRAPTEAERLLPERLEPPLGGASGRAPEKAGLRGGGSERGGAPEGNFSGRDLRGRGSGSPGPRPTPPSSQ